MAWLRHLLLTNWWLKLLSLGLAYALWLLVTQAPPVEIDVSVPLELQNVSEDLQVKSEFASRVHLHLRGPESVLREISPGLVSVVVDLEGYAAGSHQVRLGPENVRRPPGVEVVRVIPEIIALELVPLRLGPGK